MPLDENEIADIKTAMESGKFTENPELKKLSDLGLKLHTENTLNSTIETQVEEVIKPRIAEIHQGYEDDVAQVTGLQKLSNEKGYDFVKRAIPKFAETFSESRTSDLKASIAEMEKAIAEKGDPTGAMQKRLDDAELKFSEQLRLKEEEIKAINTSAAQSKKRDMMAVIHAPLKAKYRKDLPSYFQSTEKQILSDLFANSVVHKLEDGTDILVLADKEGNPIKGNDFRVQPVSKEMEILFKDAITPEAKKTGTGSTGQSTTTADPSTITVDSFDMPSSVNTKSDLTNHMLELGLTQGSDIFDKIYAKHSEGLKLF